MKVRLITHVSSFILDPSSVLSFAPSPRDFVPVVEKVFESLLNQKRRDGAAQKAKWRLCGRTFVKRSIHSPGGDLGAGFRLRRGLCNLDRRAYRVPGGSGFCQGFVRAEKS
jgi:hypothetical protein